MIMQILQLPSTNSIQISSQYQYSLDFSAAAWASSGAWVRIWRRRLPLQGPCSNFSLRGPPEGSENDLPQSTAISFCGPKQTVTVCISLIGAIETEAFG